MEAEAGKPTLMVGDVEHEKRVRKFAFIGLIVVVVALVSTLLVAGTENLPVTVWLLLLGGCTGRFGGSASRWKYG